MDPHKKCDCSCSGCVHSNAIKCSIAVLVMFVIVILFVLYAPGPWNNNDFEHMKNQSLAKNLSETGWLLYTKHGCPWCTKQLAEFPENEYADLPVIECALPGNPYCAGVNAFPTWKNRKTGETVSGYKPKSALADMVQSTIQKLKK